MRLDIWLSLAVLAGHFVTTTFVLRYFRALPPVNVHVVSSMLAAVVFVLLGWTFVQTSSFNVWPGLAVLAFGSMVFLIAYSAIYKSISLRLLIEVAQASPDAVSVERFHDEAVLPPFLDRITLLATADYLLVNDDRITITERGRKLGERLNRWRMLLGFAQSGLYYERHPASHLPNDEV